MADESTCENIETIVDETTCEESSCDEPTCQDIDVSFYFESLRDCEKRIYSSSKALKDSVGRSYEQHLKRIYAHYNPAIEVKFGKNTDKTRFGFIPDIIITKTHDDDTTTIGIIEAKGHYVDSCFLERALVGFSKAININNKREIPHKIKPILESFTTYRLLQSKMEHTMEIINETIAEELTSSFVNNTLCMSDRLHKDKWFNKHDMERSPYIDHVDEDLVKKHIEFIKSI